LRENAHAAVSITGIVGPGGATAAKPIGLVHFGLAARGQATRHLERRYGDLRRAPSASPPSQNAIRLLEEAVQ
jgi:nicotinamide-nucleotide amidase